MACASLISSLLKTETVLSHPGQFLSDDDIELCLLTLQLSMVRVFDPRITELIAKNPLRFTDYVNKRDSRYSVLNSTRNGPRRSTFSVTSCCTDAIAFILHAENHYSAIVISLWESIHQGKLVAAHFDSMPLRSTQHRNLCQEFLRKLLTLTDFNWAQSIELRVYNHAQRQTNCGVAALATISASNAFLGTTAEFPSFKEMCDTVSEAVLCNDTAIAEARSGFKLKLAALRTCLSVFGSGLREMPLRGLQPRGDGTICAGDIVSALLTTGEVSVSMMQLAFEAHFGFSSVHTCARAQDMIDVIASGQVNEKTVLLLFLSASSVIPLLRTDVLQWLALVTTGSPESAIAAALIARLSVALHGQMSFELMQLPINHTLPDKSCCKVHTSVTRTMRLLESLRFRLRFDLANRWLAVANLVEEVRSNDNWMCAVPVPVTTPTKKYTTRLASVLEQFAAELCLIHYQSVQESTVAEPFDLQQPPQTATAAAAADTRALAFSKIADDISSIEDDDDDDDNALSLFDRLPRLSDLSQPLSDVLNIPASYAVSVTDEQHRERNLEFASRDELVDKLTTLLENTSTLHGAADTALTAYSRFCAKPLLKEVEQLTQELWNHIKCKPLWSKSVPFFGLHLSIVLSQQWPMCYMYTQPVEFSEGFGVQYKLRDGLFTTSPQNPRHVENVLRHTALDDIPRPLFFPVVVYAMLSSQSPSPVDDSPVDSNDVAVNSFDWSFAAAEEPSVLVTAARPPQPTSRNHDHEKYELVDMVSITDALQLCEQYGYTLHNNPRQYCSEEHLSLNFIPCLSRTGQIANSAATAGGISSVFSEPTVASTDDKQEYAAWIRSLATRVYFSDLLLPAVFLCVDPARFFADKM